jgi:hypothetical protein
MTTDFNMKSPLRPLASRVALHARRRMYERAARLGISEVLSPRVLLGLVLAVVVLLAYPTIDHEISFYDEGVYVATAKSIASGFGYRNANLPDSPPQAKYPPLLPLLLSGIWHLFPEFPANLVLMKSLMLVMALGFLAATYLCLRTALALRALESLVVVAMIGFNPVFLRFATRLSSEIPFALLSILAVYFYHVFREHRGSVHLGLTAGCVWLAFLTRSIGIALLGAMLVAMLLDREYRRALAFTALSAVVAIPWFAWSWSAASAYNAYPPAISANYRGYLANVFLSDWMAQFHRFLPINFNSIIGSWTSIVFPWGPLAMGGLMVIAAHTLARHLRQQPRFHDLYCLFSLLLILVWPWPSNIRFILVISPFLIAYFILGLRFLLLAAPWSTTDVMRHTSNITIAVVLAAALAYNFTAVRTGREHSELINRIFIERHRMFDWIKDHTPQNAVLVSDSDPVDYLFTGRKMIRLSYPDPFSVYYRPEVIREFPQAGDLLAWFKDKKACHVIQSPMFVGRERLYFHNLIEALREVSVSSFEPIYVGGQGLFVVYEIGGCRGEEGGQGASRETQADTVVWEHGRIGGLYLSNERRSSLDKKSAHWILIDQKPIRV